MSEDGEGPAFTGEGAGGGGDGDEEEEENHRYHHHPDAAEYGEPVEGDDNSFYQQRRKSAPALMRQRRQSKPAVAPAPAERDQLVPFQQPIQDPNTMSVNYQVTDAVAYYGNVALWSLFYGRGTRGIMSPVLYDTERGGL
ncbi:MAG: hypothetical protein ABIP54_04325 [Candidatus Andersenbacteria bacterium]